MRFDVFELRTSSILFLYSRRSIIKIDPIYQRMGDIWNIDKRQLLIDSIINEFDIPKIYFHDLRDFQNNKKYEYAIIDGRQRLETIWKFIDGDFPISDDFVFLRDPDIDVRGLTYREISEKFPSIKQTFDASPLSVFVVQTDDIDLIEEMFSRLNEAVPLNAAEKRNAFGGPLPKIVRDISGKSFFTKNIRISNNRYQHRDLAAKLFYLTYKNEIYDTKKVYLDHFFKYNKKRSISRFSGKIKSTNEILESMNDVFIEKDKLLRSSGMIVLYYLLFSKACGQNWGNKITRKKLNDFDKLRIQNRHDAEDDITGADYDLLEFDRLNQTPNDAYAIKFRLELLENFVRGQKQARKEKIRQDS